MSSTSIPASPEPHLRAVAPAPAERPPARPVEPSARVLSLDAARRRRQGPGENPRATGRTDAVPAIHPSLIARLAVLAYEVLEGSRALAQLRGMITEEVAAEIRERSTARAESRAVNRDQRRRAPHVSRVAMARPEPHLIEATAVLEVGARAHAVAICLTYSRERRQWRANCLTVL